MSHNDLMFVREGEDSAGATVWWRLGGELLRSELIAELEKGVGTIPMPALREPEVVLRRAVGVLRSKRRLIRPIRKGVWAVVAEAVVPSRDELRHWNGPTITLSKIGTPQLTNATQEEVREVCSAYAHHLSVLTTEDVSAWLIAVVEDMGGVALREGGGIYYLPPSAMGRWRDVARIIESVTAGGAHIYAVPTVQMTRDGARAILDSLLAQLRAEVDAIRKEAVSGELGLRALENRALFARAQMTKVQQYESLLSTPMDEAREMIDALGLDIASAKLAAEAELDARAAQS